MKYWMSLEQWKKDKTFQKLAGSEFVKPPFAPEDGSWDRREFLKLMGASLALSSLGCLRRPAETIIPHLERPEDQVPGVSNYYASSYYDGGEALGLLVQTREGRPIKVEGHPQHPINQGGMSVRAHSHLLALYDPERLKTPRRNLFNKEKTNKENIRAFFDEADPAIVNKLKAGKTALLTDYFPSPASWELMGDFAKAYPCSHFVWDPMDLSPHAQAYKECFGKTLVPRYHLDKARMIVSVHCDFLGSFLSPTEHLKKFSLSRKPPDMSRLIVFESLLSLTGTNADERHSIRPSQALDVLWIMADEILSIKNSGKNSPLYSDLRSGWKKLKPLKSEGQIRKIAQELLKHGENSVILAGDLSYQTEDQKNLLVLMYFINDLLQSKIMDETNHYRAWSQPQTSIEDLIQQLNQKKIQNVIIHRTNPLYSYPRFELLKSALKKAELVVYTGSHNDETAQVSDYIIPDHHDLEKWGEWEFQKDIHTIQQPTLRPLISSRDFEENLIVWARLGEKGPNGLRKAASWYHYLKTSAEKRGLSWQTLLKEGFKKQGSPVQRKSFNKSALKISKKEKEKPWELSLYTTTGLKDGRLANVSWIQEFPDPVTKICWDNYLCISPLSARKLSLKEGQVVELTSGNIKQKIPIHIQPGQDSHTLGLALGYGRKGAGEIADGVGVNAYPLMHLKNQKISSSLPVQLKVTDQIIPLAVVQGHHSMEGRQIVVETTLKDYLRDPSSGIHRHKVFSLWSKHDYPREKWGMVIDLNSCTGCGACITACQSENNVPVVGKKYVLEGREMHWLRVDRYYTGDPQKPKSVVHQPVVCMHCDNAPCETVCPVAATVHSDEGTNDMIYNRCVGTRYCSNNCPYKVRRFNWFNYAKNIKTPAGALNPDVTVRSRGVMEKCTFCIHRVRSKQADARLKGKKLKDGEIQTACQQSCPSQAIVFGDLNDKNSKVRQAFEEKNAYSLLEELNTKPAVKYKTKIRNNQNKDGSQKGHA